MAPVFAKKGETLAEYWDYTHRLFTWHDGGTANLILDDHNLDDDEAAEEEEATV